ncbi:MAG: signal peptidase I [Cyclobacteriaceae bacterium]|nr:signal peptidase I [Cyclobacteriaceae bacterium]UYN87000.1 MAG: signal peptidase I [Cyclobacteriaceae bacterium]
MDAYDNGAASGIFGMIGIIYIAVFIFFMVCYWKIFEKAGKPGWAAIIPIYNFIVFLEIVGKPVWWIILIFIPIVNFFVLIYLVHLFAKSFGKDIGWTIFLLLLGFIALPILAFGDAKYVGPPKG